MKTAKQTALEFEKDFQEATGSPIEIRNGVEKLLNDYASQFYTPTEVSILIKKALDDAAERAEKAELILNENDNWAFDKESITSIDISKYLTK